MACEKSAREWEEEKGRCWESYLRSRFCHWWDLIHRLIIRQCICANTHILCCPVTHTHTHTEKQMWCVTVGVWCTKPIINWKKPKQRSTHHDLLQSSTHTHKPKTQVSCVCVCVSVCKDDEWADDDGVCSGLVLWAEGVCGKVRWDVHLKKKKAIITDQEGGVTHVLLHSGKTQCADNHVFKSGQNRSLTEGVWVCVWLQLWRRQMALVTASQSVYPGGIAYRVCLDAEEHQKEITLPSLITLTWLSHRPPLHPSRLSFYPACPSLTWSTTNIPSALFTNILPLLQEDKHHTLLLLLSIWTTHTHTHTFPVTHHRPCVLTSCVQRGCWQMWR